MMVIVVVVVVGAIESINIFTGALCLKSFAHKMYSISAIDGLVLVVYNLKYMCNVY